MTLNMICDGIILIAAICMAIKNIYTFFAQPAKKIKEKSDEELNNRITKTLEEELPKILGEHDEILLKEVRKIISDETYDSLDEIKQQNHEQSALIEILTESSKDMLRQRIMSIYHKYKKERKMPIYDKEVLDELYKDYKKEHGNSYIDKYYGRMEIWEIIDEGEENEF